MQGSKLARNKEKKDTDIELNIAPIIDAFVVLIAFLLASASFLAIGVFEAGLEGPSTGSEGQETASVNVTIHLNQKFHIQARVQGKRERVRSFRGDEEKWPYSELAKFLKGLKERWPELKTIRLKAEDTIAYQNVIGAMEQIRKVYPKVLLAGF